MTAVTASHLYCIKLGRGGDWEAESLRDGVLRFGYREAPHCPRLFELLTRRPTAKEACRLKRKAAVAHPRPLPKGRQCPLLPKALPKALRLLF
jgi:hypothetical protein